MDRSPAHHRLKPGAGANWLKPTQLASSNVGPPWPTAYVAGSRLTPDPALGTEAQRYSQQRSAPIVTFSP